MPGTNTIINSQTSPFIVNGNLAQVDDELRDIKGFQAIVIPDWFWWSLLGLVLFLAAWFVYYYIKNRKQEAELTLVELTVKKLQELDLKKSSKNFYLEYSELVRIYLEARLGMHVLDKTAEEIKPLLLSQQKVVTSQAQSLSQIFYRADLAKFAKQEFSAESKAKDISDSIDVINTIEAAIVTEEEQHKEARGLDAIR